MTRTRLRIARVAALAGIGGGAVYLFWRAGQIGDLGVPAVIFFVAELANYLSLVVAVLLFWSPYHRPAPPAPPAGAVDLFIPVCGEDVAMVEATVLAALAIDYPHETIVLNDGYIAGAANWHEIEDLCHRLGVRCLTREHGSRSKAGNLNAALPETSGEFILCLDADHLARPELATMLLGYFEDPRIAFVASRQCFELDRADALNHAETLFYRTIQPAKDRDNAAFSCGNGSAYRREAIESIGGFSEWNLVEDLRTSYELHARGWHSAYVEIPVSVGTAPATAAEMASQRLRWAHDSLRIFFWDNPLLKRGLTMRQRLHYLHTTGWYLIATTQLIFLCSPIVSILAGVQLLAPGTEAMYGLLLGLYIGPLGAMLVAQIGWRAALRGIQQQTFLAPVFAMAVVRALRSSPRRRGRKLQGGVTRKSSQRRMSGITVFAITVLVLLLVSIGVAIADPGGTSWAVVVWACFLVVSLATPGSMLGFARESTQSLRIAISAPAAFAAVLVALSVWSTASLEASKTVAVAAPAPPGRTGGPTLAPPKTGLYLGVYNQSVSDPPQNPLTLTRYPGVKLRIIHRFQPWWGDDRFLGREWLDAVAASGAVPMITWEPWRRAGSAGGTPHGHRIVRQIATGRYDAYIRKWARDAAAYGKPIQLRFMHEMNGDWYPWSPGVDGNTARGFKAAWRHVHDLFRDAGATNVSWEFSAVAYAGGKPTSRRTLNTYYPGARYVDWVGLSGFNWSLRRYGAFLSYEKIFRPPYEIAKTFKKPIMFSEVGTATAMTGRSPAWVSDALNSTARRFPRVKALVWYDARHPARDFTLRGQALENWLAAAKQPALAPELQLRNRGR